MKAFSQTPTCQSCGADLSVIRIAACCERPRLPGDETAAQPAAWQRWQGDGPAPAKWFARNPTTGESVLVYRSYKDYCLD